MKTICVRCKQEGKVMTMSYLNTDEICTDCKQEETQHPLFKRAREVESNEVRNGNYNYPGLFAGKSWEEIKRIETL
jgi:hypothetical protein